MLIKRLILTALSAVPFILMAQVDSLRHEVLLQTNKGDIRLVLYNETPRHRDNFLKLVRSGYYNGNLFHRVIAGFMVQSGDSTSRHAAAGAVTGNYSPDYTLPAEIVFPKYFHKRGALVAAHEPNQTNPEYAFSESQFYIVYGKCMSEDMFDRAQSRLDMATHDKIKLTSESGKAYFE
nr:peptidylprolyl isomerase [Prevotella phocaeensis]